MPRMLKTIAALTVAASLLSPVSAQDGRKAKSKVNPVYPELARRMNVSGTVKVEIVIAANGTVKSAKALGGHPVLIDSALEAVKRWKYEAGSEDTTQIVIFNFNPNS